MVQSSMEYISSTKHVFLLFIIRISSNSCWIKSTYDVQNKLLFYEPKLFVVIIDLLEESLEIVSKI